MFAAVRLYSGLDLPLLDELTSRRDALRRALTSVPGSTGCEVIRTRDGLMVVAVGDDEASVAESGRRFVAWIAGNAPRLRTVTPQLWTGPVLAHAQAPALPMEEVVV